MEFITFLKYSFVQKAFVAGIFIGILCSILGLFLVLRRMSLIGDGLSHLSFGAVALGLFFGIYPLYAAIPLVMLGSYGILKLTEKARMYGDTAIGIISAIGISGGVILASVSRGFNVDLLSYLFGNILAVSGQEVILSAGLSVLVISVTLFFYHDLFSATFDEEYARVTGIRVTLINTIFIFMTAVSVVLAIRVVGIMLISAMLILPAVTSLQIARGLKRTMIFSAVCSVVSVIGGITASFFLNLPAGATVVMAGLVLFLVTLAFKKALNGSQ